MIAGRDAERPHRASAGRARTTTGASTRAVSPDQAAEEPDVYVRALTSLRDVHPRPEISLAEVPGPANLAPRAAAVTAVAAHGDREPGGGRLVLLYDPDGQEGWDGTFRLVSYLRVDLEPEMAADPLLTRAAWSWLTDALASRGAPHHALAGTVTRCSSESFGALAQRPDSAEMELRASWTPSDPECGAHVLAWCDVLAAAAGLPPAPPDVSALSTYS